MAHMKFQVDDTLVLDLNDTKQKVLKNDISDIIFHDDICRRVEYTITHKYEQCFKRLKTEWEPKLATAGVEMIPTDPDKFAELVFKQPAYKSRSARDKESVDK